MKKIFAVLLVLVLGVTLIGCGGNTEGKKKPFKDAILVRYVIVYDGEFIYQEELYVKKGKDFKSLSSLPKAIKDRELPTLVGWLVDSFDEELEDFKIKPGDVIPGSFRGFSMISIFEGDE